MFATHATLIFPPSPPLTHDTSSPSVDDDRDEDVPLKPCHKELGASLTKPGAAVGAPFIWFKRTQRTFKTPSDI